MSDKPKILVIDDEVVVMEYYERAMGEYFDVLRAFKPEQALEMVSADLVAVVLDIMMPHTDALSADETDGGMRTGVVLYERIRKTHPELPIVVLTNVEDKGILDCLPQDADPHLCIFVKPDYTPVALTAKLREIILSRGQSGSAQQRSAGHV